MDAGGVVSVAIPASVLTALAPIVFRWLMAHRNAPFSSGSSADKLKAVLLDVDQRTASLHAALAKQNPNTGAYVVLESLADIRDHIVKQTPLQQAQVNALQQQNLLIERLAGQLSSGTVPRPDTRYRGGGE